MWAESAERAARKIARDMANAVFIGAPMPPRVDWRAFICGPTPPCCVNRGISGGPSPTWPHAEHCFEAKMDGESIDDCALRLAASDGYTIPMTKDYPGEPGWEERARALQVG